MIIGLNVSNKTTSKSSKHDMSRQSLWIVSVCCWNSWRLSFLFVFVHRKCRKSRVTVGKATQTAIVVTTPLNLTSQTIAQISVFSKTVYSHNKCSADFEFIACNFVFTLWISFVFLCWAKSAPFSGVLFTFCLPISNINIVPTLRFFFISLVLIDAVGLETSWSWLCRLLLVLVYLFIYAFEWFLMT